MCSNVSASLPNKLVLGTHTSLGEQNYLMIASVRVPHYGDPGREEMNAKGT